MLLPQDEGVDSIILYFPTHNDNVHVTLRPVYKPSLLGPPPLPIINYAGVYVEHMHEMQKLDLTSCGALLGPGQITSIALPHLTSPPPPSWHP